MLGGIENAGHFALSVIPSPPELGRCAALGNAVSPNNPLRKAGQCITGIQITM
jgi:hypothetical protein